MAAEHVEIPKEFARELEAAETPERRYELALQLQRDIVQKNLAAPKGPVRAFLTNRWTKLAAVGGLAALAAPTAIPMLTGAAGAVSGAPVLGSIAALPFNAVSWMWGLVPGQVQGAAMLAGGVYGAKKLKDAVAPGPSDKKKLKKLKKELEGVHEIKIRKKAA